MRYQPSQNRAGAIGPDIDGFLDRIGVGLFRSSIEGKMLFGNRAVARIFGFDSFDQMRNYPLVNLYAEKQDRGRLVQELLASGVVEDRQIAFRRRDGSHIWCSVSAAGVADSEGSMVYIDGALRDISAEKERNEALQVLVQTARSRRDFPFLLDVSGTIQDIDPVGAEVLGRQRRDLQGSLLSTYIVPKYRRLYDRFLADVLEKDSVDGILIFRRSDGEIRHVEVHARAASREKGVRLIQGIARDITRTVKSQQERLGRERFQGVLEMAGGVVHRLNQPLTVANNLVNELLSETTAGTESAAKLLQMREQVRKMNDIAKKIGNIRKYRAMDYVAGVRIVDIDRAS